MKIKKIKIHNFKSIRDYSMDFDRLKGLWEITGPVGSGKTSIGEAMLYGLFGSVKDKNIPDLITWGQKKMEVEIELESKSNNISIYRSAGTGSKFTVKVNGQDLVTSKRAELQKELEANYYDISKTTLETLCIISFKGFKSLATLTPADARKFLNSTFGLGVLTDLSDLAKEHKKEQDSVISRLNSEIIAIEAKKKVYDDFLNQKVKYTQDDVDTLLSAESYKTSEYSEVKQKFSSDSKKVSNELSASQRSLGAIEVRGREIKKHIDFISKGVCPTCGAKLDTSSLDNYIKEREELREKYVELKEHNDNLSKKLDEINRNGQKELERINKDITEIQEKLSAARSYLEQEKKCNQDIALLLKDKEKIQKQLTENECDQNEWQELAKILEGETRQSIISSIVPAINAKLTEYCAAVGFNFSIIYNDQFKCSIRNNNLNLEIPISSLSTGQLKIVDIVIIMAILDILMNGCDFNVHFLDELFSNMDIELRGKMCEILKSKQKSDQTIFVISHASLPSDSIDGTIEAVLQNGNSTFQDTL